MRLRKQLLVLSCVTLVLPYAGIKILQQLESALRQGQVETLQATANAVSAVVKSNNDWQAFAPDWRSFGGDQAVNFYPLDSAVVLDGFNDEWSAYHYQPFRLSSTDNNPEAIEGFWLAGSWQSTLSIFMRVADGNRQYYDPRKALRASDHIRLSTGRGETYVLFTAAPGPVRTRKIVGDTLVPAYGLKGVWHEGKNVYQLELTLPADLLDGALKIEVYDGAHQAPALVSSSELSPTVAPLEGVNQQLERFVEPGMRLYWVDSKGYVLAQVGELYAKSENDPYAGIAHKAVKALLGTLDAPDWTDASEVGRFERASVAGRDPLTISAWRREGEIINRAVTLVSLPGWSGAVVVEKNSSAVDVLLTGATRTVLLYAILASALVGLAGIAYASWLSYRIRRLNRWVENAIDDSGQLTPLQHKTLVKDELGELTQSYGQLLLRLQDYTDYLQHLAGKLSHELRTPLAVIQSSVENLQTTEVSEGALAYIQRAQDGSERLKRLLNAMSMATQFEQTLQHAEHEAVDLAQILTSMTAAYADAYPSQAFECRVPESRMAPAVVAPDLIVQMLDKLVENAVDFASPNTVIALELASVPDGWQLKVINTGPLMAEAMRAQVFDSMVSLRGQGEKSREEGHLGLGLYVVRMVARYHRGHVRCYNLEASGQVVFEVTLPKDVSGKY